jgi:hypothetical protein
VQQVDSFVHRTKAASSQAALCTRVERGAARWFAGRKWLPSAVCTSCERFAMREHQLTPVLHNSGVARHLYLILILEDKALV